MSYHPTKITDEWATPPEVFEPLSQEFGGFTLDPAATPLNAKCGLYYTASTDGLVQDWRPHHVWLNPPYGRTLPQWTAKAATSQAPLVVALLPARTDTRWFHDTVLPTAEVRFIRGRVYYLNASFTRDRAPFASLIAIWRFPRPAHLPPPTSVAFAKPRHLPPPDLTPTDPVLDF